MKIYITGHRGMVGSAILRQLEARNIGSFRYAKQPQTPKACNFNPPALHNVQIAYLLSLS